MSKYPKSVLSDTSTLLSNGDETSFVKVALPNYDDFEQPERPTFLVTLKLLTPPSIDHKFPDLLINLYNDGPSAVFRRAKKSTAEYAVYIGGKINLNSRVISRTSHAQIWCHVNKVRLLVYSEVRNTFYIHLVVSSRYWIVCWLPG